MRSWLNFQIFLGVILVALLGYSILSQTHTVYSQKAPQVAPQIWALNSTTKACFYYWLVSFFIGILIFSLVNRGRVIEGYEFGLSARPFVYGVLGSGLASLVFVFFLGLVGADCPPFMESIVRGAISPIVASITGLYGNQLWAVSALALSLLFMFAIAGLVAFLTNYFYSAIEKYETAVEEEEEKK